MGHIIIYIVVVVNFRMAIISRIGAKISDYLNIPILDMHSAVRLCISHVPINMQHVSVTN